MPELAFSSLARHNIGHFTFDDGTTVTNAALTYDLTIPAGALAGLVIVCPSLTATPAILQDWWADLSPADSQASYAVLYPHAFAADTLAQRAPTSVPTMRDVARGIVALVQALDLPAASLVTGGSMGGMLALEVALISGAPTHALSFAAPAVQSAWGAGWNHVQLQALALGGAAEGLALARAVGMLTYRTEREFEDRFGADTHAADHRTMAGYLRHHGQKLIQRFDPALYEQRVRAMDTHDVGRGRGGWREALTPHASRITAVGVVGDALYSAELVERWATAVGAEFVSISSVHGHDAFLLEQTQMRAIIAATLARVAAQLTASPSRS
jgi:homoserine O-acetyltransferase/O-succinyltransferase